MAQAGLLNSFLAAVQASLSVLLVISYGAIAARLSLVDSTNAKSISKICVKLFLPALLLTKIGSELHSGSAQRYVVILVWALIAHLVSFLIGVGAHLLLGMPDWITAAIMFNNTTSYPLLLIQSLDETGILGSLIVTDESTREAIERAKSYFLVFATVSSCLTFAVGPRLIDSEHAPDEPSDKAGGEESEGEDEENGNGNRTGNGEGQGDDNEEEVLSPTDQTHLLPRNFPQPSVSFFPSKSCEPSKKPTIPDRRPSLITKKRWLKTSDRTRWWFLFLYDFLNAPLLGAVLGAIIGLIPALHRAFFNDTQDGGIFTAWLTASLNSIGGLFVPLPVVVAGVSLYTAMKKSRAQSAEESSASGTPWLTTVFVLVVRFVVWPVISIAVVYGLAKKTHVLGEDPMLWFAMMLMPTGPPAMKLITMVEVSDCDEADENKIAKLLTAVCVLLRLRLEGDNALGSVLWISRTFGVTVYGSGV
ncbi:putative transporter [Lachnellula willkommii]|uniref:Putative transporter n=1 Tax=Lachnellula willkommii TaxID=215461 RepID=A0A559MAD1_9HELO|nr:putative transporter [Lachnellula willkommii]